MADIKFLDMAGLTTYDTKLKNFLASADASAVAGVKLYVDSAVSAENSARIVKETELASAISANESAIAILNGEKTVEGSVKKQIADAIDAVISGAPSSFDTLVEIANWISAHGASAAEMLTEIQANASAIVKINGTGDGSFASAVAVEAGRASAQESAIQGNIDTLFKDTEAEGVHTYTGTIKNYVDSAVSGASVSATSGLNSVSLRISAEEVARTSAVGSAVAKGEADLTSAYTDLVSQIGDAESAATSAVEAEAETRSAQDSAIVASIKALFDGEGTAQKPYTGTIYELISGEVSARVSAVNAEELRASAAESALESALAVETSARTSAIDSAIDALDATVSAVEKGVGVTIVEENGKLKSVALTVDYVAITDAEINGLFSAQA